MLPVSPALFATVVTGALRLGKTLKTLREQRALERQDLGTLIPAAKLTDSSATPEEQERRVYDWARRMLEDDLRTNPDLGVLIRWTDKARTLPDLDGHGLIQIQPGMEQAFDDYLASICGASRGAFATGMAAYRRDLWISDDRPSGMGLFFVNVLDIGLDIVATQPSILGVGGNVEHLLKALAPNFALSFDATGTRGRPGDALRESFFEAALSTLANQPGLITTKERWQPFITGVLEPLQASVATHGIAEALAARNLKEMISGPMAYGALVALDANANAFFKGDMGEDKVLGHVFRDVLGAFAAPGQEGNIVRRVFSQDGAVTVLDSALSVASERPDLFVKADTVDDEVTFARALLSKMAAALYDSPRPFGEDDGLGAELASAALDVVGAYSRSRISANFDDDPEGRLGADVAYHILDKTLTGFNRAIQARAADPTKPPFNPFLDLFTRRQAVEMVKLVADHVARSPYLVLNKKEDAAVAQFAQAVATAIAADDKGLMEGEEWRRVIVVALDTALANPGRLFGLDDPSPEQAIAVQVITRVLDIAKQTASASGDTPGFVLFGETLSTALRLSLVAAGSGVLAAVARDEIELPKRLDALGNFIETLNAMAASMDPGTVIGAGEWLAIFKAHIAHVLETGDLSGLEPAALLSVIKRVLIAPAHG